VCFKTVKRKFNGTFRCCKEAPKLLLPWKCGYMACCLFGWRMFQMFGMRMFLGLNFLCSRMEQKTAAQLRATKFRLFAWIHLCFSLVGYFHICLPCPDRDSNCAMANKNKTNKIVLRKKNKQRWRVLGTNGLESQS